MVEPSRTRRRDAGVRLTERDQQILAFVAEHRIVLESQVEWLLGTSTHAVRGRLRALAAQGFISLRRVFHGQPACCQIRRRGLAAISSELPTPSLNLAGYKHDVGAAWLWLAACSGAFGPVREVLGERRLRSHDGAQNRPPESYGIRLGGLDDHGNRRLHYPDLLLVDPHRRWLALELELTAKGRTRREQILGGYAADPRIAAVLYLVERHPGGRAIGRAVEASARTVNVADRVHVQFVQPIASIHGHRLSCAPIPPAGRAGAMSRDRG